MFSLNVKFPTVSPLVPEVEFATTVTFDGFIPSKFGTSITTSDSLIGKVFLSVVVSTFTKVCNITPLPKSIYFVASLDNFTSL